MTSQADLLPNSSRDPQHRNKLGKSKITATGRIINNHQNQSGEASGFVMTLNLKSVPHLHDTGRNNEQGCV